MLHLELLQETAGWEGAEVRPQRQQRLIASPSRDFLRDVPSSGVRSEPRDREEREKLHLTEG